MVDRLTVCGGGMERWQKVRLGRRAAKGLRALTSLRGKKLADDRANSKLLMTSLLKSVWMNRSPWDQQHPQLLGGS